MLHLYGEAIIRRQHLFWSESEMVQCSFENGAYMKPVAY